MECERAARILAKRTCDSSGLAFCNRSRVVRGLTRFSVSNLSLGKIVDRKMGLTPYRVVRGLTRFSVSNLSLGKIVDRKMGLTPYRIAMYRSRLVRGLTRFSVSKLSLGKIVDRKMGLTPYKIAIHVTTVNTYGTFT